MIAIMATMQVNAQEATKDGPMLRPLKVGGHVSYNTGNQRKEAPWLWIKDFVTTGADLSLSPKKGSTSFLVSANYSTGSNNESQIASYAKANDIAYSKYSFTKSKPSGFSVLVGPHVMLFPKSQSKKLPLMWLDLKAGAMFTNEQTLQFFQGQTTPSKEIKTSSTLFVYEPAFELNLIKTKKVFINLRASYNNTTGFGIGVGIAERDCRGALCYRCEGPGCNR